jgi:ribonuclease HI
MKLVGFTDGAARGNPGDAGIGFVLRDESGTTVAECGAFIGTATNNTAEYRALIACLKKAQQLGCQALTVYADSELMVRQLQGRYKVRNEGLKPLFEEVKLLVRSFALTFTIVHVERSKNREADKLANTGIDQRITLAI